MFKIIKYLCLIFFISCSVSDKRVIIGVVESNFDHFPVEYGMILNIIDQDVYKVRYYSNEEKLSKDIGLGLVELGILPAQYTFNRENDKYQVKILSSVFRNSGGILTNKSYKNLESLEKQRIGVLKKSLYSYLLEMLLIEKNINCEVVLYKNIDKMIEDYNQNKIQGLVHNFPTIIPAIKSNHILYKFDEDFNLYPDSNILISTKKLDQNNVQIKDLYYSIQSSIQKINEQPYISLKAINRIYDFSDSVAKEMFYNTRFFLRFSEKEKKFHQKLQKIIGKENNKPDILIDELIYKVR